MFLGILWVFGAFTQNLDDLVEWLKTQSDNNSVSPIGRATTALLEPKPKLLTTIINGVRY